MHETSEVDGASVVSCREAVEMLEAAEHALDAIAVVVAPIVWMNR